VPGRVLSKETGGMKRQYRFSALKKYKSLPKEKDFTSSFALNVCLLLSQLLESNFSELATPLSLFLPPTPQSQRDTCKNTGPLK